MGMDLDPRTSFQDFVEARYYEWEQEFGDEVDARRTNSWDPKN